ncbi:MAG: GWxTD domain-containing protein [candidate division WOR-3 bacterium]|nr:GWxTD domain-containing protein [candidate division WOR-3 bacterium]
MILILSLFCTINFSVQPVLYYSPLKTIDSAGVEGRIDDLFYLEFNCTVPYSELIYSEKNGKIISECLVKLKIVNTLRTDSLVDSMAYQFSIPSFSQAAKEKMAFYLQLGKYLPPGDYEWMIEIRSQDKSGMVKGNRSISKMDYSMSDILLARSIIYDTTGGYLTKGNLKIIPNPSGVFDEKTKNLFIYYELYNLTTGQDSLIITYLLTDTSNKLVRKITKSVEKKFSRQALKLGINIEALKPGRYRLKVVVFDTALSKEMEKQIEFQIKSAEIEPARIAMEDPPYYDAIEYFVSGQEYNYFKSLDEKGKKLYLQKFWQKHNYLEISRRYEYADAHFQEGYLAGSKTDRGRIYIKYGPPDEIENKQFEESKPYEYWQYYNGLEFVFVDIRGTQEYVLVWTNAPSEESKPGFYKYLPAFKKREIGEERE